MQRFGKASGMQRRSASPALAPSLSSASRSFESIANILDVPGAPAEEARPIEPAREDWLDMLAASGAPVSVKELAARVPLSTQDFARALVTAGESGAVTFAQSPDGTTFVQRTKS